MKIIASILIAMIFTLFWLLKFEWYFNFWTINLIWYDDTFDANLWFIKTSTDYIYHIPEIIYNSKKDVIIKFLSPYISIDKKATFLSITFFFFLIFSWLLIFSLKYFPKREDKIYLVVWSIIGYLLIVEFIM